MTESTPPRLSVEDYVFSSLACYAVYQWAGYRLAEHHRLICDYLERVDRGAIKRLMIYMPPRHGKSMLASEFFPAWYLGRNPDKQVIHCTYAQELASGFGRKVRNQMTDARFQAIFLGVTTAADSSAAHRFHTPQGGVYYAVGAGGPITGRGADLLLIDDPIKGREDADSATQRQKLKDWYQSVAYTRLMPGAAVVIIQTRWHEDDLAGWLLAEHGHEDWTVLSLPAIDDAGDALWPEAYPVDRLETIRAAIGSRDWNALYQQRPSPDEGGVLKLHWFQRCQSFYELSMYKRIIMSWDTAQKPGQLNDYSVCTVWGETSEGAHLLHVERARLDYPSLRNRSIALAERFKPHALLIEDKASGVSLAQELRQATRLSVIAIQPQGDKVMRAARVAPTIESGRVFLPHNAAWLADFEHEIATFPNSTHDDQVDSMSQYLNWARLNNSSTSITSPTNRAVGAW